MTSFSSQHTKLPHARGGDSARLPRKPCIAQIERQEGDVKAFAHLDIAAARKAADASAQRYRENRPLSAIDGMPVGIKDVFDTIDMPTEMGTPSPRGRWPDADAAHVYALRAGGGIVLGKTVTSQFAIVGNGPTRNPLDLARSPGATSAGSAAAVAAQMLPLATGSCRRAVRSCGRRAIAGSSATSRHSARSTAAAASTPAKSYDHLGALARSLDDLWHFRCGTSDRRRAAIRDIRLSSASLRRRAARNFPRVAFVQTARLGGSHRRCKIGFSGFRRTPAQQRESR